MLSDIIGDRSLIETWEDLINAGLHITERQRRDHFTLGDLIIRACGEAVIGRPSEEKTTPLRQYAAAIGLKLRRAQEYRMVASFYDDHLRDEYEAASYSLMLTALQIGNQEGSTGDVFIWLDAALDNDWSCERLEYEYLKSKGEKEPPQEMTFADAKAMIGIDDQSIVIIKRLKSGAWQIRTNA